jgi:murein DD-endopeptidase MepM/ murein hydrolase activator NlpD
MNNGVKILIGLGLAGAGYMALKRFGGGKPSLPIGKDKIRSKYGPRIHPVTGVIGEMHNGVDIAAPIGTQIKSPLDGVVSSVNFNAIGGNQIIIKHKNFSTGYSHLNKLPSLKVGDKVKKGQIIAETGNTGRSTGPHLHFSVKDPKGNFVDPLKYFA